MGVTIHYSGRIQNVGVIGDLQEEVADICAALKWDYRFIDEPLVKGIVFQPHPKCETVALLFDDHGNLVSPFTLREPHPTGNTWLSVKTQFAGAATHIAVVKLLKYLQKKYIPNMEVKDEGEYWEKEDKHLLQHKLDYLRRAIDKVQSMFLSAELKSKATMSDEEMLDRIEELLKKGWQDMDEPESEQSLKRRYGEHIKISRVGKFNLIHLDNPDEETIKQREEEFNPDEYFDDDCPLCKISKEQGGDIVFDGCGGDCSNCKQRDSCEVFKELNSEDL